MDTPDLKRALIRLIGNLLDEESIPGVDSFVEMAEAVIHYAGAGGERYLRVTLTECGEKEYFEPCEPGTGDDLALDEEAIDDEICRIMRVHGPDRHIDGHEQLTEFFMKQISQTRGQAR